MQVEYSKHNKAQEDNNKQQGIDGIDRYGFYPGYKPVLAVQFMMGPKEVIDTPYGQNQSIQEFCFVGG